MSLQQAFECESQVRRIISDQERTGCQFDSRRARRYISYIERKKVSLYGRIRPLLQLEVIQPFGVPVNKPFKKDGTYSNAAQGWFGSDVAIVHGPFTRVEFREPDLGSRTKLQSQLLRLGWKPLHFTEKGNPKLTVDSQPCPSLSKINSEVGKDIALWYILNHRQSQIQGWLNKLEDPENPLRAQERLSQTCFTIGTPTYRFRHKTLVNVPKAVQEVVFGTQMRSLFRVPKNKVMVGHDASGLELRMLAHYINDPTFTKELLQGDIHRKNQLDVGLSTRDDAKTFIYAYNYGAGDAKIGKIAGKGAREGKRIKERFMKANPKLKLLIEKTQDEAMKGYIVSLDGRRVRMRRDHQGKVQKHKALNTLLQTAGALVMKYAMVLLDGYIRQYGLRSLKVIDMHDEAQYECYPEEAEIHGQLAVRSIVKAGELLQLNCPLDGEYKIGKNWAHTH